MAQSFTNLDFESVKANLKNYLKSQEQFADYDFEGSNLNVLLDILAYNTFQNNFYTNMAISEMFLDSAQIKNSVVSHAKELNYLPRSRRSSQAVLTVEIFPGDNPSSITIPERTKFVARCGNKTYNFWNDVAYNVTPSSNGQYIVNNVDVFEGRYIDEYFEVDGTDSQRFVLQNDTIDTNSLEMFLLDDDSDTTETEWTKRTSIYDVEKTDKVFYLQPYRDNKYEMTFGNNSFGKQPINGNIIHVRYRVCNADETNGIKSFDMASTIDGYSTTETLQTPSFGGSERESLESIRYFAPKSIQIQERAVTENDYAVLLQNEFPEIQAVSVSGGERLNPPQFGRVVISAYINDSGIIRSDIKEKYEEYLMRRTSLAVEPIVRAAGFMKLRLDVGVSFNTNITSLSRGAIQNIVKNTITSYSSTNLEDFKKTFKLSRLSTDIDNSNPGIISNLIDVKMIIPIKPTRNKNQSFTINFENEIEPDRTYSDSQLSDYIPSITSDTFVYQNKVCLFRDNGNGRLDITQTVNDVTSIVGRNIGSIDYEQGKIVISTVSIQDYDDEIRFYATPKSKNVTGPTDRVIKISSDDVFVTATGTRE